MRLHIDWLIHSKSLSFLMAMWLMQMPSLVVAQSTKLDVNAAAQSKSDLTLSYLFPSDRVLDVQITVDEDDWNVIRKQRRDFMTALGAARKEGPHKSPYTYVDATITIDGHEFPKIGLRKKGFFGSQSESRPSLKVKLNRHDGEFNIEGLTTLTLNNNKQDPTLVNQFMGYAIFAAADCPAPRCSYAHVTLNGESLGVYSHVESMKPPLIKREFATELGTVYEGTVVDFHDGWHNSFEKKFGDDAKGRAKILELTEILKSEDLETIEQSIGSIVDLESFYQFWAVEGLLGFWDGYSGNRNNFFVYLHPETEKFHFLPWGADALFSKFSKLDHEKAAPLSVKTTGLVAHKLYQTPSGRKRYATALSRLLDSVWNEDKLLAETDRIQKLLEPHLGPSQTDHQRALDTVRKFIKVRRADLHPEITGEMPLWDRPPEPPPIISGNNNWFDKASFHMAAKNGDFEAVKKHLAKKHNVNARDAQGTTPLMMAVLGGQKKMVAFLLDEGADVDGKNKDGNTPLLVGAFLGRIEMCKLLKRRGADINARNKKGETPLDSVAEWNDEVIAILAFLKGVLQIPLDVTEVKSGRVAVKEWLNHQGAKSGSDLPKLVGASLWESARFGNIDSLKKFTAEKGADLNKRDDKGITPLSWAAMAGHPDAVELLIEAGADINATNQDKATALHVAAFLGRTDIVKVLIKNKAKLNERNGFGATPLDSVATEWTPEIKGIAQFMKSMLNLDLDLETVKNQRQIIAALLKEAGGRTSAELNE